MYKDLKEGLTQAISLEQKISELEDVIASVKVQHENFIDDLCEIIFEGENNTEIGTRITIDRIKDRLNYMSWLMEVSNAER